MPMVKFSFRELQSHPQLLTLQHASVPVPSPKSRTAPATGTTPTSEHKFQSEDREKVVKTNKTKTYITLKMMVLKIPNMFLDFHSKQPPWSIIPYRHRARVSSPKPQNQIIFTQGSMTQSVQPCWVF